MSQENVETFKRAAEAVERRDVNALLEEIDPEVEWHPALLASVAGGATAYRGHDGVREWLRDFDEAFPETRYEFSQIRDLGDRVVGIGHLWARGKESGVETNSPLGYVVDFRGGKVIGVRTYLGHDEALEAAGLSE